MDEEINDLQVEKSECEKLEFGCAEAPRSLLGLHGWELEWLEGDIEARELSLSVRSRKRLVCHTEAFGL